MENQSIQCLVVAVTLCLPAAASAAQPPLLERQREIDLALSACPAAVAGKAAVYVLEATGYVKVRESQNGFTAIVQHALPTSQEPQCMDAEGTRTILPRILKVAELPMPRSAQLPTWDRPSSPATAPRTR